MKKLMLAGVVAVVLAVGQNGFAYDPDALDYSFGTVKVVSPTAITLEEYDFEGDLEKTIQVMYVLNEKTEFDNFKAINELKVDEDVEVYFVEEAGKKVAVSLAKDEGMKAGLGEDTGAGDNLGEEDSAVSGVKKDVDSATKTPSVMTK